ncbi:hypothetical protein [Amnibacterium kyonggiense]
MTIPYFGPNQNLVFVPALFALLAATIAICLPIVFAPRLRRSPRRPAILALVVVVAVVALVGTAMLAARGFRTLGDERAAVRTWIATTYDVKLDPGQVGELIDGGKPERSIPSVAEALGLKNPDRKKTLELKPTVVGGDTYELYFAEKPWPTR